MPELPEVETMRRGVLPVVGARITGICRLSRPPVSDHGLAGRVRISATSRGDADPRVWIGWANGCSCGWIPTRPSCLNRA